MLNNFTYSYSIKYKKNERSRWACSVAGKNHCSAFVVVEGTDIVRVNEEHSHQPKTYYRNEKGLHYFVAIRRGGPVKRKSLILDSQILNVSSKENENTARYLTVRTRRGRRFKKHSNSIWPRILDVRSTAEHFLQKSALMIKKTSKLGRRSKDSNSSSFTANLCTPDITQPLLQNMMVRINNFSKYETTSDGEIPDNLKVDSTLFEKSAIETNKAAKRGHPSLRRTSDEESDKFETKKFLSQKSGLKVNKKRGRPPMNRECDDDEDTDKDKLKAKKDLLQKSLLKINKNSKPNSDDDVDDDDVYSKNLKARKYLLQKSALKTNKVSKRGRPPMKRNSDEDELENMKAKKYLLQHSTLKKIAKRGRPPLKRKSDDEESNKLKAKKSAIAVHKISKRGRPPKIQRNPLQVDPTWDARKAARLFLQSGLKLSKYSNRGPKKIDANQNTAMRNIQTKNIVNEKGPFVQLTALKMHKFSKYVYSAKKHSDVTSTVTCQSLDNRSSIEKDNDCQKPSLCSEKEL